MNISFMAFAVFLSFIFFLFPFSYANNTITPGQSLLDGQTMLSPTEDFVLGFFSPGNSPSRYVGIWYNRVSVRTIVWVANRNNPVPDSSGSLTMGRDGNLLVLDGTGTSLWSSNVSVASSNATAVFLDSGNLILSIDEVPNPDSAIWQSFNYPTDTYLPGMMVGLIPRSIPHLFTSWKSENDPSVGNFSKGMDPTGMDQIVVWEGSQRRWRSGLWDGQIFTGVPNMTSNYLFGFRVFPVGGRTFLTYSVHNSSEFLRFRLKWDGTEEEVLWDEGRSEWRRLWAQPTKECEIYNTCGAYGSCNRWNSQICSCIQGFEPRSSTEWRSGNWSGGCVRRKPLLCDRNITNAGEGDRDQFLELDEVKLPDFSFARPSDNRSHCADICLNNCSCKAYAYVSGISCLTWSRDFVDVQIFREGGQKLYIRLAASEFGESNSRLTLIIVLVVVFGTLLLCTTAFVYWRCRSKSKKLGTNEKSGSTVLDETRSRECWSEFSTQHDVEGNNASELPMHSLQVIVDATNNFSTANKLGEGGFGPVYKGKMPCGLEVAVKRLSQKSFQGLEEFKNEIILIAKLQHRNLVRLVGFCVEGEEKMLLYEYLPNKSLDAFIFANQQKQLSWNQRSDIIEGIARGLLYLHRDSRLRIIHRDLKASNILLDEEMNPKISDFGMAKIFGGNQNQANTTRVVGTYGYMAPEYAMEGLFSVKSDVYSFGVLLLEIVSGKKNQYRHPEVSMNLIGYAWKLWGEERAAEFIDPSIRDSHSQSKALRCINIGLLCVQDSAMDRPIMSTVVLMLESDSPILPTPRQPTFTMGRSPLEIEISLDSSEAITKNSMSDTMVVGR